MRARVLGAVSAVIFIVAACGGSDDKGKTPSGARASCAADADCVVSNKTGCCKACPDQPFGIPSLNAEQMENKCRVAQCAAPSDRIECPTVESKDAFVAVCKDGTCAVKKK